MEKKSPSKIYEAFKQVYKHNLDQFKLLTANNTFQEDVRAIRDEFDIPQGGFKEMKTTRRADGIIDVDWYVQLKRKHFEMINSNSFRRNFREARKEFEEGKITYNNYQLKLKLLNSLPQINKWTRIVRELTGKCGLADNFRDAVERYTLLNRVTAPGQNYVYSVDIDSDDREQVKIIKYGRLTNKELEAIKEKQEIMEDEPRKRPKVDVDRDVTILKESQAKDGV